MTLLSPQEAQLILSPWINGWSNPLQWVMEGTHPCSNEMGYLGEEEEHREEEDTAGREVCFGASGKRKECSSVRTQAVKGRIQGMWEHTAGHITQPGCGQGSWGASGKVRCTLGLRSGSEVAGVRGWGWRREHFGGECSDGKT